MFCIKDDGSVSYYGYKTVSGNTLDVNTSHLCHFAAVEETEAVKEAVKTMAVEPNTGLEGSAGGTVTPGSIVVNSAADSGAYMFFICMLL